MLPEILGAHVVLGAQYLRAAPQCCNHVGAEPKCLDFSTRADRIGEHQIRASERGKSS